jgi:hypothetical protein
MKFNSISNSGPQNSFNPFGGSTQPQQQSQQQQQPQQSQGGLVNLDPMSLSSHNSFAQAQAAEAIKNPFAPKMGQSGSSASAGYQWQSNTTSAQPTLSQLSQQRAQTFTGQSGAMSSGNNNPLFGMNPNASWSSTSQQQPLNQQQNLFGGQQQQQQPLFGNSGPFGGPMGQQQQQQQSQGQQYMGGTGGSLF